MRLLQCLTLFILAIFFFALGDTKNLRKRSDRVDIDADAEVGGYRDSLEIEASAESNHAHKHHKRRSTSTTENIIDEGVGGVMNMTGTVVNDTEEVTFGILDDVFHIIEMIPIIGPLTEKGVEEMKKGYRGFEKLTNGFLGRLLGGSLPCTITLNNGTTCEGVKRNGGMSRVVINAMEEIPLMPRLVIQIMNATLETIFDPMTDVLVGGVPENY